MESRKQGKKKRRIWRYILIAFLVLIIGAVGVGVMAYRNIASTADNIHTAVETDDVRGTEVSLSDQEPFSVLLLGIDNELDAGRSDSMIVATVNPNDGSTKMLSIPRDTRTEIIGRGTMDKINHAYAFGGVEMSINTVQNFLNIPIDYFVEINMEGIQELVDAVGGITVENNLSFSQGGDTFAIGTLNLNGSQALNYARMRKEDPRGDFGRQERQRQVIEAIVREMASFTTVTRFNDILSAVEGNMRTNVTMNEIIDISMNYRSAINEVEQMQLTGTGQTINGIWYLVPSDEDVSEKSALLRGHLELE